MFNFILSVRETFQLYKLKTATNALDLTNLEHYDFFVNVKLLHKSLRRQRYENTVYGIQTILHYNL